eukprot:89013-Pelagomonas_calceolata.AAC.1
MEFASKFNGTLVMKSQLFNLVKGMISVRGPTNTHKDVVLDLCGVLCLLHNTWCEEEEEEEEGVGLGFGGYVKKERKKERKIEGKKDYACQVRPHALRKGHLS